MLPGSLELISGACIARAARFEPSLPQPAFRFDPVQRYTTRCAMRMCGAARKSIAQTSMH